MDIGTFTEPQASVSVTNSGLPPVRACRLAGAYPAWRAKLCDRVFGEWRERQAAKLIPRQVADYGAQWVAGACFFVSIGEDEHCAGAGDAAPEEFEEVQGGFIGPMHVFKYDGCWRAALQVIEKSAEDDVPGGTGIDPVEERPLRLSRNVM